MAIDDSNIKSDGSFESYKRIRDNNERNVVGKAAVPGTNTFASQSCKQTSTDRAGGLVGDGCRFIADDKLIISGRETQRFDNAGNAPGGARIFKLKYLNTVSRPREWVEIGGIDLTLSDGSTPDTQFGKRLDATRDGLYLGIGAHELRENEGMSGNTNVGAVVVFQSGAAGYSQEKIIQENFGQQLGFGEVIEFNKINNRLAVGVPSFSLAGTASFSSSNHGVVFVYNSSSDEGWQREVILTSSYPNEYSNSESPASNANFGATVTYSGSFLAASEYSKTISSDGTHNGAGAVYLFKSSSAEGWDQIARISSSVPVHNGNFGFALRMFSDNRIAISEPGGHIQDNNVTGSVQIWQFTDGGEVSLQQAVPCPLTGGWEGYGTAYPSFGHHIALLDDGSVMAVSRCKEGKTEPNNSAHGIFVFLSGASGYNFHKRLTRDFTIPKTTGGRGYYGADSTSGWRHDDGTAGIYPSSLDIRPGIIIFGCNAASDSKLSGNNFGYQHGELRVWQDPDPVAATPAPPPFSFGGNFPWTIRGQSTERAYSTTIFKGRSLKS